MSGTVGEGAGATRAAGVLAVAVETVAMAAGGRAAEGSVEHERASTEVEDEGSPSDASGGCEEGMKAGRRAASPKSRAASANFVCH